jgi:hypothetical protein
MANLTFAQLEALWNRTVPGSDNPYRKLAPVMAAIALAESSGNPRAINRNDNNGKQSSFGLWQISNGTHSPPAPNWYDPSENARLAYQKLTTQGLKAWGTWVSGAYKTYLAQNHAQDTSGPGGPTVAQPPGASGGGGSGPLGDVTALLGSAGTLLGDAAKALDWFFHMFKPGQGWRLAFGAGAVIAFYGGVRSWMAATRNEEPTAALPLAVFLFALSAMAAFMTLRQWPTPGGKPITPGAYAVDIVEGKPPSAGAAPASDVTAIEVGLGAILALWGASKVAQGLSGVGGILGDILGFLGLKGAARGGAPVEVPPVEVVP